MPTEQLTYWFPLLTDNSPFLFAVLDKEHNYLIVNNRYCELSGYTREDLIGCCDKDILGHAYYQTLQPYYDRAFNGESVEGEVVLNDNRLDTSMHFSLTPLRDDAGNVSYIVLHSADTSERQVLVKSLEELEHQLNQLHESSSDGICMIENNIVLSANQRAATMLGFGSAKDLLGEDLGRIVFDFQSQRLLGAQLHHQPNSESRRCYIGPEATQDNTFLLSLSDVTMLGSPAKLVLLRTPTNNRLPQGQIDQLVQTDALTGLYNRHGFTRKLEQNITANIPLVMLYLDVDNFKNINDSLGHHIGDRVLQEIAQRLKQLLPDDSIIGHLGGDEFGILLLNPEHERIGDLLSQQIIALVSQPFNLHHFSKHIACSIGLVNYPGNGNDARILLQNADTAMYEAKNRGRNRLVKFDESMNKEARMRLWLEIELQKALQKNGLEVWYQPKVNAKDFSIDGAEALVRWKHPVEGYISPAQFIPVAERSGLIEQLGRVVMREVFTTVREWKKQGLLQGRVAINLSPQQFGNPNLILFIDKLRKSTGINPSDITFELTESAMMNDGEHAIQMLKAIKKLGFALSIDDFGTGYSSLSYLARFPLDELKVDRAFIKDIETVPKQVTLIENIINLGKSLNMSVVAEGVETHQQATLLSNLNCDSIQGFHFFRPQPKHELEAVLVKNSRQSA
ncbi:EAL domain-containing protein [Photobacterium swingsii]|uniref:cyclic-guanylate-specific phosphodiesterase n=1 Tax=Photobacterium swingsii TaxID=680026 RepID=A0A0J8VD19_9GAMM|nr:EAL domain-containing protein [Photobacterium swingsii]KMV31171.1 c-di-GMP phosphodiesterase [Photobacterium swingsii]PSW24213.1 PAS domain S-box protein [Photobacterium swingsii]